MKYTIFIFFCIISTITHSQNLPAYGMDKVRITQPDEIIVVEIKPISAEPAIKPQLFYYWYSANAIHSSQGGFSGKLLDGQYTTYYPDRNLKEQGNFKKGLKEGVWKNWKNDGSLMAMITWKHGSVVAVKKSSLWKRMHFWRKRAKDSDTISNVKK